MKTQYLALYFCLLFFIAPRHFIYAAPPTISKFIHIDQFGYKTQSKKIAVISDPIVGFNSSDAFTPSVGTNQYQLRKWNDDAVVFTGTISAWNNGATDATSGDRAWWFDFSAVTTAGEYYVFDVGNNVGSYKFKIDDNVYNDILKAAMRMYYYNRCNATKQMPYTESTKWVDGASFIGNRQDKNARAITNGVIGDASTEKDLSGGWWDAGDFNKYTTFARQPVHQLLTAYTENKTVWGDDYNIPESGNGIPDIIDEVKWELDFLKKMQLPDGSSLIKVGNLSNDGSGQLPPSADTRFRYYYPGGCTSATIANASVFAHAAYVLKQFPSLATYAADLEQRAINGWNNYRSFGTKQTNCDDQSANPYITAGDADETLENQNQIEIQTAIYLFALTGNTIYRDFVDQHYTTVNVISQYWWGPYGVDFGEALLFYASLPDATPSVALDIKNKKSSNSNTDFYRFSRGMDKDPYRAFMEESMYHWGSNSVRAQVSNINYDMITYSVDVANAEDYKQKAEEVLHYFHGVNPLNICYLSNMYSYGGDFCVNEFFHSWFSDGSDWDNALTSPKGPPPGYLPGGPNKNYASDGTPSPVSPPDNQPPQKSYLDWNAGWPQSSWSVTEPAIYYQAAYVKALSHFVNINNIITATNNVNANAIVLKIFPNPTDNYLFATIKNGNNYLIQLYDISGRVVMSKREFLKAGQNSIQLPKNLSNGIYALQIADKKLTTTFKVILQ